MARKTIAGLEKELEEANKEIKGLRSSLEFARKSAGENSRYFVEETRSYRNEISELRAIIERLSKTAHSIEDGSNTLSKMLDDIEKELGPVEFYKMLRRIEEKKTAGKVDLLGSLGKLKEALLCEPKEESA